MLVLSSLQYILIINLFFLFVHIFKDFFKKSHFARCKLWNYCFYLFWILSYTIQVYKVSFFPCRYNLDPDNRYTDDNVWKALEIAQLKDTISSLPEKIGIICSVELSWMKNTPSWDGNVILLNRHLVPVCDVVNLYSPTSRILNNLYKNTWFRKITTGVKWVWYMYNQMNAV